MSACVALGLALCLGGPVSAGNQAFWSAASAPTTLYTPLQADTDAPVQVAWCDGSGQPSCSPAAPVAPQQSVSFSQAPVAVLPDLRLRMAQPTSDPFALQHVHDAREGVRARVERPPRS